MSIIFSARSFVSGVTLLALTVIGCADERRDHPVFLDDLNDVERFPSDDRQQLKAEHANLPQSMVVRVPVDAKGEPRAGAQAEVKHFDRDLGQEQLSGERMASVWGEGRSSNRARVAHNLRHVARDYERGRHYSTQHDPDMYGHHGKHGYHGKRGYRHGKRGYHHGKHGYHHGKHGYRGYRHDGGYRHRYYNSPLVYNYGYRQSYPVTYWYRYYRPYYRSVYYPNLWWGNYRPYNTTYYQPSGFRYFVYCPQRTVGYRRTYSIY